MQEREESRALKKRDQDVERKICVWKRRKKK
jgi:hypothetical protein